MTDPVKIALYGNLTTILVVVLTRLWSHWDHRATKTQVDRIEKQTNDMKDQLVKSEKVISHQEGVQQEKADEQARKDSVRG